ncbi:MAG: hypothetical protein JXB10_16360 [Pirellulales bacterium]|nr:hypothetical protein [Pirellulales bacterium]
MPCQPALADGPRDPKQPLWAPEGRDLDFVPIEIQQAADEIIKPIYEQFVVNAPEGLEKSLGLTLCHLLWLEVLDQFDLKREYTRLDAVLGLGKNRESIIAQHIRLIDSKVRIGYFLVRLRELRKRLAAYQFSPLPLGEGLGVRASGQIDRLHTICPHPNPLPKGEGTNSNALHPPIPNPQSLPPPN